jgi:hypothetical protein
MKRNQHVRPVPRVALSPAKLATALDLSYEKVILPAVNSGQLGPVFLVNGSKHQRRILVEDAVVWLRSQPHLMKKISSKRSPT